MPELICPGKPDFEVVFETHYDRVYKYAYTILRNKAVNKRYQRLLKRCRQILDGGGKGI